MKPIVYILKHASFEELKKPIAPSGRGIHVLTGLVVYEKDGRKMGMVIDPGMICDFAEHKKGIEAAGLGLGDITHLLVTHFHQDHVQSLALYPFGTQIFSYGASAILGQPDYGAALYQDFIEIPEINFYKIDNAHTKKDTIYIVDSANEGKVAFIGDMIFATFADLDKELQKSLDKGASVNPDKRFEEAKKFFDINLDIQYFYPGHGKYKVSREEMGEYFEKW